MKLSNNQIAVRQARREIAAMRVSARQLTRDLEAFAGGSDEEPDGWCVWIRRRAAADEDAPWTRHAGGYADEEDAREAAATLHYREINPDDMELGVFPGDCDPNVSGWTSNDLVFAPEPVQTPQPASQGRGFRGMIVKSFTEGGRKYYNSTDLERECKAAVRSEGCRCNARARGVNCSCWTRKFQQFLIEHRCNCSGGVCSCEA
jgi:hypothetical protein